MARACFTIAVAIGALVAPLSTRAQGTASASLAVQAQVVTPLQIAVTHALDFGKMLAPSTKSVSPSSSSGGKFYVVGQGGSAVTVTLTMPSSLAMTGGSSLPISGWSYVVSDIASLTGSTVSFSGGTPVPINTTFASSTGSVDMYFGIGATATASAALLTGVYNGTGQISAAYADL